jgi:hypothetical protein
VSFRIRSGSTALLVALSGTTPFAGCDAGSGGRSDGGTSETAHARCSTWGPPIQLLSIAEVGAVGLGGVAIVATGETTQVLMSLSHSLVLEEGSASILARTIVRDSNGDLARGALSPLAPISFWTGSIQEAVVVGSSLKTWFYGHAEIPGMSLRGGIEEVSFGFGSDGQVTTATPIASPVPLPPSCLGDVWAVRATTDETGGVHLATSCDDPVSFETLAWVSDPSQPSGWLPVGDPQAGTTEGKLIMGYQHVGGIHYVFTGSLSTRTFGGSFIGADERSLFDFHPLFASDDHSLSIAPFFAPLPDRGGLLAVVVEATASFDLPAAVYTGLYRPGEYGRLTEVPAAGLTRAVELPEGGSMPYFATMTAAADGGALSHTIGDAGDELWCWGSDGKLVKRIALPFTPFGLGTLADGHHLIVWPGSGLSGQTGIWAQEVH